MGLDNGVSIKRDEAFERHYDYFKRYDSDWCMEEHYDIDICYWRKCYNVRAAIFDRLDKVYDNDYSELLDVNDIGAIIEVLASFNNEEDWEDSPGSIWTWDEIRPRLVEQCAALSELMDLMRDDPEIKVYFYDSY